MIAGVRTTLPKASPRPNAPVVVRRLWLPTRNPLWHAEILRPPDRRVRAVDQEQFFDPKGAGGKVLDYPGGREIGRDELIDVECDIWVPAARPDVINSDNVDIPGPNYVEDAQEIYFGLSKALGYGIDAELTYYWDIETDNNGYLELGLAKTIDLDCSDCLSLGLETKLGYAVEQGEFANLVTSATLDWAFNDNATLSPYIALAIEGSENEIYEAANEYNFVAGVSLEVTF